MNLNQFKVIRKIDDNQEFPIAISENLWNELLKKGSRYLPFINDNKHEDRIVVSITFNHTNPIQIKCTSPNNNETYTKTLNTIITEVYKGKEKYNSIKSENENEESYYCYISNIWYSRYSFISRDIDSLIIEPTGTIELDEIFINAKNDMSYSKANENMDFITEYLLKRKEIVQQNSILEIEDENNKYSYDVIMCLPVLQGYINEKTSIILSNYKLNTVESKNEDSPYTAINDIEVNENFDIVPEELFCLSTGISLNANDGQLYLPTNSSEVIDQDSLESIINRSEKIDLSIKVLQYPLSEEILEPKPEFNEDPESRIYVSVEVLIKLHVFSGNWVYIKSHTDNSIRPVHVYAIEMKQNNSQVLMSPILYNNLGYKFDMLNNSDKNDILSVYSIENSTFSPPIATEITISRVASPSLNEKKYLNYVLDLLKNYFNKTQKVFRLNDLIPIVVNDEKAKFNISDNINGFSSRNEKYNVVYFKVTKINSKGDLDFGVFDPIDTRLIQVGVSHSFIPTGINSYLNIDSYPRPIFEQEDNNSKLIYNIISSSLLPQSHEFELSCNMLLYGTRGVGKRTLIYSIAEMLGINVYEKNCFELLSETETKTENSLRIESNKVISASPCIFLLNNIHALTKKSQTEINQDSRLASVFSEIIDQFGESHKKFKMPCFIVAVTDDIEKTSPSIQSLFRYQFKITNPSEYERLEIIKYLIKKIPLAPDISINNLATQTAAFVARDINDIFSRSGGFALSRILKSIEEKNMNVNEEDIIRSGIVINADDIEKALEKARVAHSDSIGAPKIPNVTWDDVGGLANVKNDILDTIQLPLEHPELFAGGMKKRSGILLFGPPGTGKTLVAKAIATTLSLNFLSVKGPELLNMYVGESEANVRRVFQRARDARPCVVFFDELDSVAPKRGAKGDSGGVMDRIVSQILAELDGVSDGDNASGDVFVIGATNRPDLLDPALLRPGRFDKLLYLGVSQDHESQLHIIKALTRKFNLHPDLDLAEIANCCSFNFTGADFYALCSDAILKAMIRTIEFIDKKIENLNKTGPHESHPHPITPSYYLDCMAEESEKVVQVSKEDFQKALKELIPSVSEKELEHYKEIQQRFSDMIINSDTKQKN